MGLKLIQGQGHDRLIADCVTLDKECYKEEYQGNLDIYMHIYKTNPDSFIFLIEDNKLIGYSIITPITDSGHGKLFKGDCIDTKSLKHSDFISYKNATKLYIYSLVIHHNKRNNGLSNILLDMNIKQFKKWKYKNENIDMVFADVINSKLKMTAIKKGFKLFKKTNHNSEIICLNGMNDILF